MPSPALERAPDPAPSDPRVAAWVARLARPGELARLEASLRRAPPAPGWLAIEAAFGPGPPRQARAVRAWRTELARQLVALEADPASRRPPARRPVRGGRGPGLPDLPPPPVLARELARTG